MSRLGDEERRALMARFKGRDTKPEMAVRRCLHRNGRRFRLHRKDLPGKPDIVMPRYMTAIFVHGCFWHFHQGCPIAKVPKTNPRFWQEKFAANKARDERATSRLLERGWRVVTLWECEICSGCVDSLLQNHGLIPATEAHG